MFMSDPLIHTAEIRTRDWSAQASLLDCPRCGADLLHHAGVTTFDRGEDVATAIRTEVRGRKVSVDASASNRDNPSSRRDGIVIDFWCEGCGEAPLQLTIAQHKGSTEIGWRFEDRKSTD